MAKKPATDVAEGKPQEAAAEAGAPPEGKKTKESKPREAKAKPAAPPVDKPLEGPPAAAPMAETSGSAGSSAKKKGKRPGVSPIRGKKLQNHLRNVRQKIAKDGPVPLKRAITLLKQMKRSKFDETVEIHMALGIDTSQSDQMIRGTVPLPFGIGKTVRVVVFCQGDNVAKARDAGADFAGAEDLIEKVQKENWLDFDVALATQDMMGKVSRLGKVLGPRGLMPTPKAGTVVTGDVAAAVRDFKAGKVEYRTDKGGNVHAGVGKLSFDEDKLVGNVVAFVDQIKASKPTGVKGNYLKSVSICSTMSPGIPVVI